MSICFWSAKGGSGCSATAAAVAISLSKAHGEALLVDMAGDQPAVLGATQPKGPGLADWLSADRTVPPDALGRLEVQITPSLRLLPAGETAAAGRRCHRERAELLARLLGEQSRPVVIDVGMADLAGPVAGKDLCDPGALMAARCQVSLLVVRLCYLALRRAVAGELRPSGVVVVAEQDRALDASDVARLVGVPIAGQFRSEPAVARAIDSGLLVSRTPRALVQGAAEVIANVA